MADCCSCGFFEEPRQVSWAHVYFFCHIFDGNFGFQVLGQYILDLMNSCFNMVPVLQKDAQLWVLRRASQINDYFFSYFGSEYRPKQFFQNE